MKSQLLVTNIQKYTIHDGDGIRTTVFFKGCPLSCIWCHNPEAISFGKQLMYDSKRCIGCHRCEASCPNHAINYLKGRVITNPSCCTGCAVCLDYCATGARDISGTCYSVDQLLAELRKDLMFYEQSGGGVTLSGGEVMAMDMDDITALVMRLQEEGIRTAIDTCGFTRYENLERILPYVSQFLYDIKLIDKKKHVTYTGKDNTIILANLIKLNLSGANLHIRIPVIPEVNADRKDMADIIMWLSDNKIKAERITLLPYHSTGSGKYDRLDINNPGSFLRPPSEELMQQLTSQFRESGFTNIKVSGKP